MQKRDGDCARAALGMTRVSSDDRKDPPGARGLIARGFTWVEDIVYVGLGLLLAASAATLLVSAALMFSRDILSGASPAATVGLLDRLLLTLMVVELLYTVQISFREHSLVPEPFLIVGLVAATRRILVVTAELTGVQAVQNETAFRVAMIELAVLTVMILVLVISLVLLRRRHPAAVAARV
jgi:uncharacterized membrane protein (DUF373 family)